MARREILLGAVAASPERLAAAEDENHAYIRFLRTWNLESSSSALILYLTHLATAGPVTGRAMRNRLALLSLAQRLAGEPGWDGDPDVRAYLRGLHRELPIGTSDERSDPIYRETQCAIIDALMLPRPDQLRDRAVVLLANETLWPARALCLLRWYDVRFFGSCIEIDLPALKHRGAYIHTDHATIVGRSDDLCVVSALRALRRNSSGQDQPVFASTLGHCRATTIENLLTRLPRRPGIRPQYPIRLRTRGTPLRRILSALVAPGPLQLRDRVLVLIGFGAALHPREALALRQTDIEVTSLGLILNVPGRAQRTGIPRAQQSEYCAVAAWTQYQEALRAQGRQDLEARAFLSGRERTLRGEPMSESGLNGVIRRGAETARLTGRYTFSGLRAGFIRTALREGAAHHDIATHAGYRYLYGVSWHERREQLIRSSVAGQVGL